MTLVYRSVKGSPLTKEEADGNIEHLDENKINNTGNETIAGVKTFSSSPIVPTATTAGQAVNKAQLDAVTFDDSTLVKLDGSRVQVAAQMANDSAIFTENTNAIISFTEDGDISIQGSGDLDMGFSNTSIVLGNALAPLNLNGSVVNVNGVPIGSTTAATEQQILDHTSNTVFATPLNLKKHTMITKLNLYTNFG